MSSIGIMDPAFFVGKAVLLKWLNDLLELNYTKVEQCCTGAAHCQILDIIWPGKVPLSKVNFDAKFDYEWVANFKILQGVFTKMEVPKHVDVEKLVKGKYQDNLEFLQWMKNFFETKYTGQEYHAKERRDAAGTAYRKGRSAAPSGVARPKAEGGAPRPAGEEKKRPAAPGTGASPPAGGGAVAKRAPSKAATGATAPSKRVSAGGAPAKAAVAKKEASEADSEALATLQATIEGLEKERNFYFGKLREIEILCQTDESVEAATKKQVLQILYHTDDDNEFQSPQDAQAEEEAAAAAASKPQQKRGGKQVDDEELVNDDELLNNGGEALSF